MSSYASPHYRGSGSPTTKADTAAAERICTGEQIKLEHFGRLTYAETTALFRANPDRYRKLAAGIDPDADAWTPGDKPTAGKMQEANL